MRLLLGVMLFISSQVGAITLTSGAKRDLRLGLSVGQLIEDKVGATTRTVVGPLFRYEFAIKPSLSLGIHAAYRYGKNERSLHQFVYGLVIQHYLNDRESNLPLYVSYGLLMQVMKLGDVKGGGTAHDTRLALGFDFTLLESPHFFETAYNYSRLHYFNENQRNLDHWEFAYGVRF
ncbi:MAG: hypothetical protein HYW48_03835 [Deltaproteobacteria bacterium]|nr:hypothetical protein [Deltaproteobacteria bacterium]